MGGWGGEHKLDELGTSHRMAVETGVGEPRLLRGDPLPWRTVPCLFCSHISSGHSGGVIL